MRFDILLSTLWPSATHSAGWCKAQYLIIIGQITGYSNPIIGFYDIVKQNGVTPPPPDPHPHPTTPQKNPTKVELEFRFLGCSAIYDIRPKLILNSNLAKSRSFIISAPVVQSLWNFAQWYLRALCQISRRFDARVNEILRHLSLRWVSDEYPILNSTLATDWLDTPM